MKDTNVASQPVRQKELHIAPMLDVTQPEFLNFFRILTKRAVLWTEMVVDDTILHSQHLDHHLNYNTDLNPIICQIGGRSQSSCQQAMSVILNKYNTHTRGYDEINLNIDCPSSRVSGERKFGAILMHDKQAAVDVMQGMHAASTHHYQNLQQLDESCNWNEPVPISIKTRVGIEMDDGEILDTFDHLVDFTNRIRMGKNEAYSDRIDSSETICKRFYIHARKCVIGGLTPAQNRIVPCLNYPRVYDLCRQFPDCEFVMNGGISGLKAAKLLCRGTVFSECSNRMDNDDVQNIHDLEISITENEHSTGNFDQNPTIAVDNEDSIHDKMQTEHELMHRDTAHGPCKICNTNNGGCIAPPVVAPDNLVGCMLGRACMENPAMFWDVDRYFYGEESNPCQTRREVLEKYCEYLERTYPKRCCDDDDRKTSRLPAPSVDMRSDGGCYLCQEFYGSGEQIKNDPEGAIRKQQKEKITARAIGRCLKPVRGLFFGLPKGKQFRLECDRMNRDTKIRNCGPGYILRKIMTSMPQELLDQPFVKTEDLKDEDVIVHVAPVNCRGGCNTYS